MSTAYQNRKQAIRRGTWDFTAQTARQAGKLFHPMTETDRRKEMHATHARKVAHQALRELLANDPVSRHRHKALADIGHHPTSVDAFKALVAMYFRDPENTYWPPSVTAQSRALGQ